MISVHNITIGDNSGELEEVSLALHFKPDTTGYNVRGLVRMVA